MDDVISGMNNVEETVSLCAEFQGLTEAEASIFGNGRPTTVIWFWIRSHWKTWLYLTPRKSNLSVGKVDAGN